MKWLVGVLGSASGLVIQGVPSSAGAYGPGQEKAPGALREAGLLKALLASGLDVQDLGDLPMVRFVRDDAHPRGRSLAAVREVVLRTAERTREVVRSGARPLVLGGDCTITLGVVAGMLAQVPALQIVYLDGDVDLMTPDTTTSGILDGMVLANLLGFGSPELSRFGPRFPLMDEKDIVLFGYNDETEWFEAPEAERLAGLETPRYRRRGIPSNPAPMAEEALRSLPRREQEFLVHFDVDVMNFEEFPAAECPHYGGLSFTQAMQCLRVFVNDPGFAGLVVTEFNPDMDVDGRLAARLVKGLADALARRPS